VANSPEIIVTIGPTLEKPADLRRAIEAGARWFRLPCGYRQRPHLENARCVRAAAVECGVRVQLLLDLPSSRPRTGDMEELRLEVGAAATFWDPESAASPPSGVDGAAVPLPGLRRLVGQVARGHRLWFCDGQLEFLVADVGADKVVAHLVRGRTPLKASNSLYLPDAPAPFMMLTPEDDRLLSAFAQQDLVPDWISLSLVSSAEDVRIGREELRRHFGPARFRTMAKIETAPAVEGIEAILQEADAIMVARGDLAPAVGFIRLPETQQRLIEAAKRAGQPVVVATQILEHFAEVGTPKRSELSDLSLLAAQAPDAVLLCKETAYSPRAIECIRLARDVLAHETRRLAAQRKGPAAASAPSSGDAPLVAASLRPAQTLYLLTTNPRKFAAFADLLAKLEISLRAPDFDLPELQDDDSLTVLERKARTACEALGVPCLVDDSGLLLDAYPGFPGPLTGVVLNHLGAAGLERLLAGTDARGRMVCRIACCVDGTIWHWSGEVRGRVDPSRPVGSGPGPLTQWFVPDEDGENAVFGHRRRALEALARDLDKLRRAIAPAPPASVACNAGCVFCQEFDGQRASIFHDLTSGAIPSRIIHQTPHFLVFPPLGQFVEGGLLITTREHFISMAELPSSYYGELEALMAETADVLLAHYGCRPVFFEHAPLSPGDKGTCCVDHAHLNVFPVAVDVHKHLKKFPHAAIDRMEELASPTYRGRAYLFVQGGDGRRNVYQAGIVPSQYIRKIIATALGMPERWHWREYLGLDELKHTMATLSDWK
jgi:pyruvate kinase